MTDRQTDKQITIFTSTVAFGGKLI